MNKTANTQFKFDTSNDNRTASVPVSPKLIEIRDACSRLNDAGVPGTVKVEGSLIRIQTCGLKEITMHIDHVPYFLQGLLVGVDFGEDR